MIVKYTIESDEILAREEIQYFGPLNEYQPYVVSTRSPIEEGDINDLYKIYPTISQAEKINIEYLGNSYFSF